MALAVQKSRIWWIFLRLEVISALKGAGIGSFILGAIYAITSLLLLAKPVAAAIAVPFVIGVILLVQGATLVTLALRVRAESEC